MHPIKQSSKETVRVTFSLPPQVHADTAAICGDFNNWSRTTYVPNAYGCDDSVIYL